MLDCTENYLCCVKFATNFKKLKELYFDDNKLLGVSSSVMNYLLLCYNTFGDCGDVLVEHQTPNPTGFDPHGGTVLCS